MSEKRYDPKKERKDHKDKRDNTRNFSNRMYGYEEGDEEPSAAGDTSIDGNATRGDALEKGTRKTDDRSLAHDGFGHGNDIDGGTEGPQGYSGEGGVKNYEDEDYDGATKND